MCVTSFNVSGPRAGAGGEGVLCAAGRGGLGDVARLRS